MIRIWTKYEISASEFGHPTNTLIPYSYLIVRMVTEETVPTTKNNSLLLAIRRPSAEGWFKSVELGTDLELYNVDGW